MFSAPKITHIVIAIVFIIGILILPLGEMLAATTAAMGSITIIKTTYPSFNTTDYEFHLDSPGDPEFLSSWGSQGSGEGEFDWSQPGMDIDTNGNVYVADELNNRIQKFDSSGNFVLEWGSQGAEGGQFEQPSDVIVNANGTYVFVVDTNNHRIQKFSNNGGFLQAWGWGVEGNDEYEVCTTASACVAGVPGSNDGQFSSPGGAAMYSTLGAETVYVADAGNNRIQYFDLNGNFTGGWGSAGNEEGQFQDPTGLAADRDGNIYVADRSNHRMQKFTSEGEFDRLWGWGVATGRSIFEVCSSACRVGSPGSGEGQFNDLRDVDVDTYGYVYAADSPDTITKFDPTGNYLHSWGSSGSGDGEFDDVGAVAVDYASNVFTLDINNYRVQQFVASSFVLNTYLGSSDMIPDRQTYDLPVGIYTISEKYDTSWDNLPEITCETTDEGDPPLEDSPDVVIDLDDGEEVTCTYYNVLEQGDITLIKEENPADGVHFKFLWGSWDLPDHYAVWGERGSMEGQFNIPAGVTADSGGYVYVVDRDNNRVQKFDLDRSYQRMWGGGVANGTDNHELCAGFCRAGTYGDNDGQFDQPQGIAVDSSDTLYVADTNNHRIQKFSTSGAYLGQWGSQGTTEGLFESPNWIAVDSYDNVYVVDQGNFRIQKFDSSGNFILMWGWGVNGGSVLETCTSGCSPGISGSGAGQFESAQGIAASSGDLVYVADSIQNNIQVFDLDGNYQYAFGGTGDGEGQYNEPVGVAADTEGRLFVADKGNDRVQKFEADGTFISQWGRTGSFPNEFDQPAGIAVDSNGYVVITEQFNQRVNEFRVTILTLADPADPDAGVDPDIRFTGTTGSYKVTELDTNPEWRLKSITCETSQSGDDPVIEPPSVYFTLDRDEDITCTFYNTIYEDPVADFEASPTEGGAGMVVDFTNLSTGDIDTCSWDFGDTGTSDTCENPSHTYDTPGLYTVSLTVNGPEGEDTETKVDHITVKEVFTEEISLVPGWNLVSFSLHPHPSTSPEEVLASIDGSYDLVYSYLAEDAADPWKIYDVNAPAYANDLTSLTEINGFWINMAVADNLVINGTQPYTTTIPLSTASGGWNMVGYPSIAAGTLPEILIENGVGEEFTLMYAYHAEDTGDPWKLFDLDAPGYVNDLTELTEGWGYWLYVTADTDWEVTYDPTSPAWIEAYPNQDQVHGYDWPEGSTVTLDINAGASMDTNTVGVHPEDPELTLVEFNLDGGFDLGAGDVVELTDGVTTKTLTVTGLEVTDVDEAGDSVTGTTDDPSLDVEVWVHEDYEASHVTVTPDGGSGDWSATLPYDIVPGKDGAAVQPDPDGDLTWIDWRAPAPWIEGLPEEDRIQGLDWPEGSTVTLDINSGEYSDSGTVGIAPWDPGMTLVEFDLTSAFDVVPGDTIELSGSGTTKSLIVTALLVTDVDPSADTVSGTTDDLLHDVEVWVHENYEASYVTVSPDGGGNWVADLSPFDLVSSNDGAAVQPDDDGDVTWINWTAGTAEQGIQITPLLLDGSLISVRAGAGYTPGINGSLGIDDKHNYF